MKSLLLMAVIFLILGCSVVPKECLEDSDCVPAQCCHPTICVPKDQAPNCQNILCSQECKANTMDCGQGYCECQSNVCTAVIK